MKILPWIKNKIWRHYFRNARLSYSQSGEDMILDTIFWNIEKGTYIDVGANNPFIQSNTHYFYQKGWHGVNIDALPGSMHLFKKHRSRDINIEAAISNDEKELIYYMFKSSFYNTFCDTEVEKNKEITYYIGSKKIKTTKLEHILDSLQIQNIEFMSIDVEGLDLDVLLSNNWSKYRPKVIITEYFSKDIDLLSNDKVYQFLKKMGYRLFCNTGSNAFYIEKGYYKERFGA